MKPSKFIEELEKIEYVPGNVLVMLMTKYDHEKIPHYSNEILTYNMIYGYEWLNDWNEGQETAEVLAWIDLDIWHNTKWNPVINGKLLIDNECPLCKRDFDVTCERCDFFKFLKRRSKT